MSRLDYSNGLLYGLPKCTVSGLLAVQHSAARIVTQERMRNHDSMSRVLMELHWLPVGKRIEYKMLIYTYKALHGLAPGYLCELVVPYAPRRDLRSAESNLLTVPLGNLVNMDPEGLLGICESMELSKGREACLASE